MMRAGAKERAGLRLQPVKGAMKNTQARTMKPAEVAGKPCKSTDETTYLFSFTTAASIG